MDRPRERAMFLVMYNTGTRVSEVIGLRRRDLHLGSSAYVHVHGKGRKTAAFRCGKPRPAS